MATRQKFVWYPGHMAKALREMQSKLKQVDLVLEVRDARLPFTSANPELECMVASKRRVLLLNKWDLCNQEATAAAAKQLRADGTPVFACTATMQSSTKAALQKALSWLEVERPHSDLSIMMIMGIPNVGKSSLINALKLSAMAKGLLGGEQAYNKKARTGPLPGVTLQLGGFQVSKAPSIYVLDTPGVMLPHLGDDDAALKFALIGGMKEGVVPEAEQVKYLLRLLSQPVHQEQLWQRITRGKGSATLDQKYTQHIGRVLYDVVSTDLSDRPWHPGIEDQLELAPEVARRHERVGALQWNPRGASSSDHDDAGKHSALGYDIGPRTLSPAEQQLQYPWRTSSYVSHQDMQHSNDSVNSPSGTMSTCKPRNPALAKTANRQEGGRITRVNSALRRRQRRQHPQSPSEPDVNFNPVGKAADADADVRLQEVLIRLGVAGERDPSFRQAMLFKILAAFRHGALGRYTLDDVPGWVAPARGVIRAQPRGQDTGQPRGQDSGRGMRKLPELAVERRARERGEGDLEFERDEAMEYSRRF